jgi:hypothetical protein
VTPERESLPEELVGAQELRFRSRRTFGTDDLAELVELIARVGPGLSIAEARDRPRGTGRVVALRHDVDHDLANAVAFGRAEVALGLRSSYYLLHTDWYYRAPGAEALSKELLDAADELVAMGHEVGLHNNAITAALASGTDPVLVLERELECLRRHGFDVVGTVAHGDPLCRKGSYVNSEIFVECPRPKLGAPDRTVVVADDAGRTSASCRLRPVPMADLGLEYEAGFIGHDLYLSDTGGRWSRPLDDIRRRIGAGVTMFQVLTHPVWWAFDGEPVRPRPPVSPGASTP